MKRGFFTTGLIVASLFCFIPAAFAVDGFGQYTTGGAGGATVTVTNGADFLTYVETVDTPYIIQVSGTIELSDADGGRVRIQSNKTIRGIGENPTIIGSLGFKNDCSNVIIERLTITCPKDYTSEEDGISVKDDITNVFITKCTIYDCWDGCLDIARRSDYVTVSWCKFYFTTPNNGNSNRVSLVGNTDSSGDEGTLHVTFHHNWFGQYCLQRMPSLRYGRAHIYNNYYNCPGDIYCVWSRIQAECLIENNYFKDVYDPYVNNRDGAPVEEWGKIGASGNILDNCTGTVHPGTDTVFTPPYSYTLDNAADIPIIVQNGAGADGNDFFPPHWIFGPYGDFDRSNLVDTNDLEQFVEYWLDTNDISDINDADYNEDGIVNGFEYALLANNWLQIPSDLTAPAAPDNMWASAGDAVVVLDWDDNNEPDLDGYNVYRSTSSGSGYTKLNGTPLLNSDYTDDTVSNGTMYYYVVTAVDTSENESDDSAEACGVPGTSGNSITLQEYATGFCYVDGSIENEHAGYTGFGYANTDNSSGTGIDWSINIVSAGSYTFKWRYANGSSDRPGTLLVNGSPAASGISFPATGGWASWSEVSVIVSLTTGIKDVRLQATGGDGLTNIDYLMVTGAAPQIAGCP